MAEQLGGLDNQQIQFGMLISSVDNLGKRVDVLAETVVRLDRRIASLEADMQKGKGFFLGSLTGASLLGGGLGALATKLLERMA